MALDPSLEIFARKWFRRYNDDETTPLDVMKLYEDECLADPECSLVSDNEDLYKPIMFRHVLFEPLYTEEIIANIEKFQDSKMEFYRYVLSSCSRADLFGNLSIFERVFATCAFVSTLCLYCEENENLEVMKYGYLYWTMYFDQFTDEFYTQGGWDRLKMVAISYRLPMKFITNFTRLVEDGSIDLPKIRKAIKSYLYFKRMAAVDHDECVSISWIKFYKQYINGNLDNDQFSEDFSFSKLENCSEVEDTLKQIKYLCDPNGAEILKYQAGVSTPGFLETSVPNHHICESKEKIDIERLTPILTSGVLEKNNTFENLSSKSPMKLNFVKKNDLTCKELGNATPSSCGILSKQNNFEKIENVPEADRLKAEYFQLEIEHALKIATVENSFKNLTISEWEEGKKLKEDQNFRESEKAAPRNFNFLSKQNNLETTENVSEADRWKCLEQALTGARDEDSFEKTKSEWEEEGKEHENRTVPVDSTGIITQKADSAEIRLDYVEEIKINKNNVLVEHLSCAERNAKNMNISKTENDTVKYRESEIEKSNTRCTSERASFTTKNAVKGGSDQDQMDVQGNLHKRKGRRKIPISHDENNTTTKNNDEIQNNARNKQDEYKTIHLEKKSTIQSANLPSSKPRAKKRKGKKKMSDIKKHADEIKEKNGENYGVPTDRLKDTDGTEQISTTGGDGDEENMKARNSLREEQKDGDIKKFLSMLLVLGDKQGINYLGKTL